MRVTGNVVTRSLMCAATAVLFAACLLEGDIEAWRKAAAANNGKNKSSNAAELIDLNVGGGAGIRFEPGGGIHPYDYEDWLAGDSDLEDYEAGELIISTAGAVSSYQGAVTARASPKAIALLAGPFAANIKPKSYEYSLESGAVLEFSTGEYLYVQVTAGDGKTQNYYRIRITLEISGWDWDTGAPTITAQPQNASAVTGQDDPPALSVTVTSPDGGTLQYQWYSQTVFTAAQGTAIANATGTAFTPDLSVGSRLYYYVEVWFTFAEKRSQRVKSNIVLYEVISHMTGITLDKTTLSVVLANTATLKAAPVPLSTTDNYTVAWVSSNPAIAAVDPNGLVTALTAGSTIITATATPDGGTALTPVTCNITVIIPLTATTISKTGDNYSASGITATGSLATVIDAIREAALGATITITFDGTSTDPLNIGSTSAVFTNSADSLVPWGTVILKGSITGSRPGNEGTVYINADGDATIKAILKANIANTNTATGTSLANTGKAVAIGVTDQSVVEIQDGAISAVGTGNAVYINAGTVTISGGMLTSANNSANTTSGTTCQAGSGSLIITGGTITNTNDVADARTVYSNSTGATKIYGGTITGGSVSARVITIASATGSTASLHLAGSPTITGGATSNIYFSQGHRIYIDSGPGIPPVSFTNPSGATLFRVRFASWPANSNPDRIAVVGGAPYESNFSFSNGNPTISGNNLLGGTGATW